MSTLSERGLRPVAELAADRPQVTLRYLSVCSGIEAASVAWHPLGWQPVAFSEIEPFPSAVLAHHYPNVPNLGDMTRFEEWPVELLADADILVGGTPCQAFSVAGKRESLADARGNLSLTYIKLLEAIDEQRSRAGRLPAICIWENVPGVLSTKDNAFGCFLAGLVGEEVPLQAPRGKWKDAGVVVGPERLAAWRILDAQFFGVAQRRRRVFLVSVSLRHPRAWACAAAVLPLIESVRRDSPPRREAREAVAGGATQCFAGSRQSDVAATLETTAHDYSRADGFNMVAHALRAEGFDASEGGTGRGTPLVPVVFKVRGGVEREDGSRGSTNIGKQAGKGYLGSEERAFTLAAAQDQFVAQPVAFHNRQDPDVSGDITHPLGAKDNGMAVAQPIPFRKSRRAQSVDDHETWVEDGVSNTLNCFDVGDVRAVDVVAQPVAYGIDGEQNASEELIGTLRSHQSGGYEGARVAQPVAFEPGSIARNAGPVGESPLAPTLRREMGDNQPAVRIDMQVRRLTPVECERLQGFPDGYTNIPWRKKPEAPDGPRYKALGNSMAVPCMAWIGKRIAEVDRGD